jgi:pimeloyl-ACP methyl ester carboxylesterase
MSESHGGGLLAALQGQKPEAPDWFSQALAAQPEQRFNLIDGVRLETLVWGERGKPGLLLMHGNGAHAHWWSFIAPFFARDWRVVAFSWSGMGQSQWRETGSYRLEGFIQEALGIARAEGLYDSGMAPVFVGHSFGGFPTMACAARHGEQMRAAVIVDSPIRTPAQREQFEQARHERSFRSLRIYPEFNEALMRFRFMPVQGCEHLYIADHIARHSLRVVAASEAGPGGYTWSFDPFMWRGYRMGSPTQDLAHANCPIAFIWGGRSSLFGPPVVDYARSLAPAGTPMIEIPDADHHVMIDQPLAFVAALRGLLAGWPG